MALALLFGGARFVDLCRATDLNDYDERRIGTKDVFVGRPDMLVQDVHQRGRPYLYQTDDEMFVITTEQDSWAEDAIRQLP